MLLSRSARCKPVIICRWQKRQQFAIIPPQTFNLCASYPQHPLQNAKTIHIITYLLSIEAIHVIPTKWNYYFPKNQQHEHAEYVLIQKKFYKNIKEKTKQNPHVGGNNKTTTTWKYSTSEPQKQQPSNATLHAAENKQTSRGE
jgi:hypothetical protein